DETPAHDGPHVSRGLVAPGRRVTAPDYAHVVDELTLLDWKRRIFELYAEVRAEPQPERAWEHWRDVREALFRSHAQTPSRGTRPRYFDYDPELRVEGAVEPSQRVQREIATSGERSYSFTRFGRTRFQLGGAEQTLDLYW